MKIEIEGDADADADADAEDALTMVRLSENLDKILVGQRAQLAVAAVNFTFLKMVLSQEKGLITSQAMVAVFINNVMNSISSYYSSEDEPLH
jgi:hypothetical protein